MGFALTALLMLLYSIRSDARKGKIKPCQLYYEEVRIGSSFMLETVTNRLTFMLSAIERWQNFGSLL